MSYKFGLVFTLLHRCFVLSSSLVTVHSEFEKLKAVLKRNGYLVTFSDKCVKKFFDNVFTPRLVADSVPKEKRFVFCLPYLGSYSLQLRSRLMCLFRNIPQVDLVIVFTAPVRMSNFFQYKDKLPKSLRSGVVYQFQCTVCNNSYYSKTKRHLHTRVSEHGGFSPFTGKPVKS